MCRGVGEDEGVCRGVGEGEEVCRGVGEGEGMCRGVGEGDGVCGGEGGGRETVRQGAGLSLEHSHKRLVTEVGFCVPAHLHPASHCCWLA